MRLILRGLKTAPSRCVSPLASPVLVVVGLDDHPGRGAGGIGTPAEAEQADFVTVIIVDAYVAIGFVDEIVDTSAKDSLRALLQTAAGIGTVAVVVVNVLRDRLVTEPTHSREALDETTDIGNEQHLEVIPGAVATYDQSFLHP